MAGKFRRRGAAVTALALASSTTLALATAAPAGASKTHASAYYQGVTSANVLGVAPHLPSALLALPRVRKDPANKLLRAIANAVNDPIAHGERTSSTAVGAR